MNEEEGRKEGRKRIKFKTKYRIDKNTQTQNIKQQRA